MNQFSSYNENRPIATPAWRMSMSDNIQLFEDKRIRMAWDEEKEEWLFSIVDVVGVLTEQPTPRNASTYWAVLKKRLNEEGADQLLTNCKQLKMTASDGRKRLTDVANTEQLLRIIQSVPSPKAEAVERRTGKPVITSKNAIDFSHLISNMIEDVGADG